MDSCARENVLIAIANCERYNRAFPLRSPLWLRESLMTILLLAVLVLVFLLLVQLAYIGADLRAIRNQHLPDLRDAILKRGSIGGICVPYAVEPHCTPGDGHGQSKPSLGCFVIWEWRNGKWYCRTAPEGIEASLPPGYPGAFEGDLAKTWQMVNS